jgi:hypothetical protein
MTTIQTQPETAIQQVAVSLCHLSPANKSRPLTDEFVESVRMKQRQPGLVRPHPDIPGEYEVVYGARRLMACQAVGHECLAAGSRPETLAEALGWSAVQVRRCAQLLKLSPSWRRAIAELDFPKWGSLHFECFAYLPEESQEELFGEFPIGPAGEWSVKDVERWVAERTTLLKAAPWELEDETLVAQAGACTACPDRSSCTPDLFAEASGIKKQDRCLNAPCYSRKMAAWLEQQYAKAIKKHGRVVKITKEFNLKEGEEDVLHPGQFTDASKGDEGAVAALVVRGQGLGKVEWVTLQGTKRSRKRQEAAEEAPADAGQDRDSDVAAPTGEANKRGPGRPAETMEQRRAKLEERRWAMALEMLRDAIDMDQYTMSFPVTKVVAMAVAFGVQSTAGNGEPWKALAAMEGWEKGDLRAALLAQVKRAVVARLLVAEDAVGEGRAAAEVFGIDLDAMKALADLEIPEPAGWGKAAYQAVSENGDDSMEGIAKDAARRRGEDPGAEAQVPDMLFNRPEKQKAYLFLKQHPGKDFETFQLLTGDMTVTPKQFWEVEAAIKARAERLKRGA